MELILTATQREMDRDQARVFYELLNDIPPEIFRKSVLRWLQESERDFLPTIGQLRRYADEFQNGIIPHWSGEWRNVIRCIGPLGMRHKKVEAQKMLGPFTWKIVSRIGWDTLCDSEMLNVEKAMFRTIYESEMEYEMSRRRISPELHPVVGFAKPGERKATLTNG